jgi:hypothetical protein
MGSAPQLAHGAELKFERSNSLSFSRLNDLSGAFVGNALFPATGFYQALWSTSRSRISIHFYIRKSLWQQPRRTNLQSL